MTAGSEYQLCLSPEDDACSDSNPVDYSIDDHQHYFNVKVSEYGKAGCTPEIS